mmetsp:Transcript_29192/g.44103  ORF Transcript_29192/g.44103 Transcript_29192/m.44103 type:complete len:145 (-) Transcript_29192:20-454(-)
MPHGDFSDIAALSLIGSGIQQMLYPFNHLGQVGFLQSVVPKPTLPMSADAELMCQFLGGLLLMIGCTLFTVRWNTINGKLSGLALIVAAANGVYRTYFYDKEVVVPRPIYVYAVVFVLSGLHLMFNANPMPGKADEQKKTKKDK